MADTNLIVGLVIFSLALVGAFFGSTMIIKSRGRLRTAILTISFSLILFSLYHLGKILDLYTQSMDYILINFLHVSAIALMLVALIGINQIISNVRSSSSRIAKKSKKK